MITRKQYNEWQLQFAVIRESLEDDDSHENIVNQGTAQEQLLDEILDAIERQLDGK